MKARFAVVAICFISMLVIRAQETVGNQLEFSLLRQNDEILIYPADKNGLYEKLKQLQLGKRSTLSFGGSYRFQSEAFINEQFSAELDQGDIWFLNRFQFHTHLKVAEKLELFAEINSSLISSKANLSPVDRDDLAVNQFFARYIFNDQWNLLLGRQNLRLGSGRLVDIREGPNVRLSFDMAQLEFQNPQTNVTAFYAVPVRLEQGVFDNDALDLQESVAALYWTQNWNKSNSTDVYAIYKEEEAKTWDSGTADDNRLSLGLRHFGSLGKIAYNNEFVYQTGSFGNLDIRAWTASFNLEYPIEIMGNKGVVGLKTEVISGDKDADDGVLNTFDGLYPRGAYFGRVARIGPSNLFDIHPYVNTNLDRFSLELDYVAFWRFSREDGVYGPPLNLQYPSDNTRRFIGHQIGTITSFAVNRSISLELETNLIFPGDFLADSGLDDTLFHTVFTAEFKF
ncbi:alginate export family protein [Poritiphilus flavus]|uniref:Alginate export family protein n=1 Tax=Poritiphilus flavus TaxID=2697053 RepID=A0A6L9E9V9_9FLAO|nr:alginate export family protein [Poritiphilus flavus]NAS11500.1 alginate export family protein [Poritiphilus flavus]